jgi:hypothetical protein
MFKTMSVFAGVAVLAGSASASIVVNGSFENPLITSPLGFEAYYQGSTGIAGWTVTAPSAIQGVDIVSAAIYANSGWAFDGVQSVELAGTPGRGGIEQALLTTPGQGYILSFALSSQSLGGIADGVSVFWNGVLFDTLSSPGFGTWQTFSYNVTGGAGSTSLLSFVGNVDGNIGTLLDNVVVVVPSPGAFALLGMGGLLAARRRR